MAFKNENFAVTVFSNGFTGWLYKANEPIENIIADNFFEPVSALLNCGDTITIVASNTTDNYYVSHINPVQLKKLGE